RISKIDCAARRRTTRYLVALEFGEVVVRVQVVKRAMLAEAFVEVAALHAVDERTAVRGVIHFAIRVERDAVAVGTALAEEFEFASDRVVTPQALLELEAANATGSGAAVHAIEPAIGTPSEMVGHGLGVFHAKTGKQNFGIAIGDVVAVGVGIEEQIG